MSEKSHTVAIGIFVSGAILIAVTMVIFALGTGFGEKREKVVMVFEGSVKGLSIGAPVALRGVQIGQVTNIELMLDTDAIGLIMLVEAEISEKNIRRLGGRAEDITDQLIHRGLRAQLRTQSLLTGLLYIQLDFHPGTKPVLADIKSPYVQIPTVPTDLEVVASKLEEMDLGKLADEVQGIIGALNKFLGSEDFQAIPAQLQGALQEVTALSRQLQEQVAVSGPKLDQALNGATATLNGANQELPRISELVEKNLNVLNQAITGFEGTMRNIDGLVAPNSPTTYQLNQALQEVTRASRAIQALATTLQEQPESLLRGKSEETP
jgi:paraquat-inducible protein B